MEILVWTILSLLAIIFAIIMIAHKNPLSSALSLVVTFCALGGLYFLLAAPLIGALQILIYAGAIIILFVLVIMLVGQQNFIEKNYLIFQKYFVFFFVAVLGTQFVFVFLATKKITLNHTNAPYLAISYPRNFAKVLFENYAFPFELTSIILLLGIIGAIVITRSEHK